jgi:hypothetical protein
MGASETPENPHGLLSSMGSGEPGDLSPMLRGGAEDAFRRITSLLVRSFLSNQGAEQLEQDVFHRHLDRQDRDHR